MSVTLYLMAINVFASSSQRSFDGVGDVALTAFREFDQHRKVHTVENTAIAWPAGHQRKVRRRSAENISDDYDAITCINSVGSITDFRLFRTAIVFGTGRNSYDACLMAHYVFHRREVFTRKAAMSNDHDSDHAFLTPICRPTVCVAFHFSVAF
jgi:hypothetical protein